MSELWVGGVRVALSILSQIEALSTAGIEGQFLNGVIVSLGVFVVCALGLCYSYFIRRRKGYPCSSGFIRRLDDYGSFGCARWSGFTE